MVQAINVFDKDVEKLVTECLEVNLKANFIDLHILKLYQELIILRDFEAVEDELSDKVNQTLTELIKMEEEIVTAKNVIESHKRTVENLTVKEKDTQEQFILVVQNNKFFDFLKKIFKKKYKPPKVHQDGGL